MPRPQHSPRLGQNASSQTVCSASPRISDFSFQYSSFWFSLTRSHSGLRPVVGCSSCSRRGAPSAQAWVRGESDQSLRSLASLTQLCRLSCQFIFDSRGLQHMQRGIQNLH